MTRCWLTCGLMFGCGSTLWAAGKVDETPRPDEVSAALKAELESGGDATDRRAALSSLRAPDRQAPVWWQSGFVSVNQDWLPFESASGIDPKLWQQYQTKRAAAQVTSADQVKLADWCRESGLADQERTHLIRALTAGQVSTPDKLLRRLGYRPVGRWWFTEDDLKTYTEETQAVAKEWKRLQPRLEKLAVRLEGKPQHRTQALEELRSLTGVAAIPVLEQTLALRSESTATAVVDVLSDIASYRSSQALARLAVISAWDSVREAATDELKSRPWEEFIPMTLALMHLPVETNLHVGQAQRNLLRNPAGGREWRFVFTREGRHTVELAALRVIDCRFIPISQREWINRQSFRQQLLSEDTARQALDTLQERLNSVEQLNEIGGQINERSGELLAAVTDLPAVANPTDWWNWWDQSIDAQLSGPKQVVIVDERLQKIEAPIQKSCLAAGTPVRTEQGFVAIEKIQIGDRVLAKNVETGELAYKPVLHTTRRENAKLSNITVGEETFAASPGHNFWISGRGWTRTNQLQNRMSAHTVTGTARLTAEDADRVADVFNLVVADFHTYFVGKSLILGHDVTPPSPTDVLVPGLKPEFAQAE